MGRATTEDLLLVGGPGSLVDQASGGGNSGSGGLLETASGADVRRTDRRTSGSAANWVWEGRTDERVDGRFHADRRVNQGCQPDGRLSGGDIGPDLEGRPEWVGHQGEIRRDVRLSGAGGLLETASGADVRRTDGRTSGRAANWVWEGRTDERVD